MMGCCTCSVAAVSLTSLLLTLPLLAPSLLSTIRLDSHFSAAYTTGGAADEPHFARDVTC